MTEIEILIHHNLNPLSSFISYNDIGEIENLSYRDNYECFNSSIIEHNGKILCAFRASSFDKSGIVDAMHTEAGGESILLYGEFNGNNVINVKEINVLNIPKIAPYTITGLEDPRLFIWNNKPYALCSHPYGKNGIDTIEVVLVDIENESSIILKDPFERQFSKNWIPVVKEDGLYIITDVNPMRVYKLVDENLELVSESTIKSDLNIHGGSTPFIYNGKMYTMVHGRFFAANKWVYWHSIVEIKDDWNIKLERFFYFDKIGTEFSSCAQIINDELIITYSVDDKGSKFISVPKLEMEKIL